MNGQDIDLYRLSESWQRIAIVPKVWGYEVWHFNTEELCMKTLVIYPGHACSLHGHKIKYEIFTCLDSSPEGQLILTLNDKERRLNRGDHVIIERGQLHTFRCEGNKPAALLEFSTHHREDDSYRVNVSHKFAGGEEMEFLGKVGDFKGKKILCIGDICLDVYERGKVERLSPEAPCPVLLNTERDVSPGCVGNVAVNIASLGGNVSVVSVTGEDEASETLEEELSRLGILYYNIYDHNRPTICKVRFMVGNYHLLRWDSESQRDIDEDTAEILFENVERIIKEWKPKIIYLADYDKGVLTPEIIRKLIAIAKEKNIISIADPKMRHFKYYKGVDILKPNEKIASRVMELPIETVTDISVLAQTIIEKLDCNALVLTRGGKGMYLSGKDGTRLGMHIPARYVEVSELSGAGDTVGAALALGIAADWTMEDAARVANVAASLVVQKSGTASCTPSELAEALTHASVAH